MLFAWVFWAEIPALSKQSPCGGHVPVPNATMPSVTLQPPHSLLGGGGRGALLLWLLEQGCWPHPELQAVLCVCVPAWTGLHHVVPSRHSDKAGAEQGLGDSALPGHREADPVS